MPTNACKVRAGVGNLTRRCRCRLRGKSPEARSNIVPRRGRRCAEILLELGGRTAGGSGGRTRRETVGGSDGVGQGCSLGARAGHNLDPFFERLGHGGGGVGIDGEGEGVALELVHAGQLGRVHGGVFEGIGERYSVLAPGETVCVGISILVAHRHLHNAEELV